MTFELMADAAYAATIPPGYAAAAGYYGGPDAYHVWPAGDWGRFPGFRLPIWVGGTAGGEEGSVAVVDLHALGVPDGSLTVIDMEIRNSNTDVAYVQEFGAQLQHAGYKVWVYGSASTVFRLPPLNGYWVASYGISMAEIERLMGLGHVRAVQYANHPGFDASLVKAWTAGEMWHG